MIENKIIIKGARVNNLKNIDVEIPQNKLVVITGLSGSGKSSLAFDTLYAEGQRRYVESLSSYARQFLGKISKPDVDAIQNIPPAIAIEQRVIANNPRSTVGTITEIYEYLKLLFARVGRTYSPISGNEVKRETVADVVRYIYALPPDSKVYLLTPIVVVAGRTLDEQLNVLKKEGYSRLVYEKQLIDIDDFPKGKKRVKSTALFLMVDRFKAAAVAEMGSRLSESIESAFTQGKGVCVVQTELADVCQQHSFTSTMSLDGIRFEEPTLNLFSFNNPYGACTTCGGLGVVDGVSPDLVIPNPALSVFDAAVACWHGEKLDEWRKMFIRAAARRNFPIHRAIEELSAEEYNLLWNGDPDHEIYGVKQFFEFVDKQKYKIQYRIIQARYRGRTTCPDCNGLRLRKEANYVKIKGKSISELVSLPVVELYDFFKKFDFDTPVEETIAKHILVELVTRLGFLLEVGLGYLSLNRAARTLSGGESQRINLAATLGSCLVGSLYVLDEPSIGLHPRDTEQLISVLKKLRDIGNTVVVVEHDEEIIRAADYIIDIGPRTGRMGGEIVFYGNFNQLLQQKDDLTAAYIRGMCNPAAPNSRSIPVPTQRRKWRNFIEILGAKEHNLKKIDVKIPLQVLTLVTGVSGSGKSTLIKDILYPGLQKLLGESNDRVGKHTQINADLNCISEVIIVDQNPLGKTSRSNPAIYIKAFDDIRELFASQPLAKQRGYKASYFSFNTSGGRCEECEGQGVIHVSMQFMADVDLECSECHGKHFKDEILDVKVAGKDISDVLDMTINQAIEFFETLKDSNRHAANAVAKLKYLQDVGLGYLKMGQPSHTLSGGESQRVKLAFFLVQGNSKQKVLFIFDEPTTGLHFHDINKLYQAFTQLVEKGNSIIVIEHNPELIKCADWVIDLGPEGGNNGGYVVCEGTPEDVAKNEISYTGKVLASKLFYNIQ